MPHFICTTCGTQYAESDTPPRECPICLDERQYVGPGGQGWTTLGELRQTHWHTVRAEEPGLIGVGIEPKFAIGQRALLVRTAAGNVLWDCVPLLDNALVEMIRGIGGISAIAISHPHYYTTMAEWARAFDCPVYLHAADRQWVMRPDPAIEFWDGETKEIGGGLTLVRCGGHFEGGTACLWCSPEGRTRLDLVFRRNDTPPGVEPAKSSTSHLTERDIQMTCGSFSSEDIAQFQAIFSEAVGFCPFALPCDAEGTDAFYEEGNPYSTLVIWQSDSGDYLRIRVWEDCDWRADDDGEFYDGDGHTFGNVYSIESQCGMTCQEERFVSRDRAFKRLVELWRERQFIHTNRDASRIFRKAHRYLDKLESCLTGDGSALQRFGRAALLLEKLRGSIPKQ